MADPLSMLSILGPLGALFGGAPAQAQTMQPSPQQAPAIPQGPEFQAAPYQPTMLDALRYGSNATMPYAGPYAPLPGALNPNDNATANGMPVSPAPSQPGSSAFVPANSMPKKAPAAKRGPAGTPAAPAPADAPAAQNPAEAAKAAAGKPTDWLGILQGVGTGTGILAELLKSPGAAQVLTPGGGRPDPIAMQQLGFSPGPAQRLQFQNSEINQPAVNINSGRPSDLLALLQGK